MSRTRVADLPRDRQAQLVLRRALARLENRRGQLAERYERLRPDVPDFYRGWPMSLPNPRWVVEDFVRQHARLARSFTLDEAEVTELVDALLVALALEAAP